MISDHRPQTPDMADSKMDDVKIDRKLKGKTNFVSWKREFERAAKTQDILEYLTGEELVPPKPKKEDYSGRSTGVDARRLTRSMTTSMTPSPSTEGDEDFLDAQQPAANQALRWQIDSSEYKSAKENMKLAGRLLDAWVSDGIRIETEDCSDAKEAYDFIKKRYAVTDERARDNLLNELSDLKLEDCSSMTEYTNIVRQYRADLKTVKYDMTDDMLATVLLHGLPPTFRNFKENYDWIRSTKPDESPDMDYLYDRLHVEEAKQIRLKEERKARDRPRKETSTHNHNASGGANSAGKRRPRREDRSHLKCNYPGCGKTGHTEENCWTKDPSKAPRSIKDRSTENAETKLVGAMGGTTEANLSTFKDTYSDAEDLGTVPPSTIYANNTDASPQTRSVRVGRGLWKSGGVSTRIVKLRQSGLAKKTLGAFLVGTSCTPDTWLADTGANMHIVNNIKWFKGNTFRSFPNCSMDISTADGSTTLDVKGGGTVQVLLKNLDGSLSRVSLSDVAYAPQGKCNLFSGGIFAQKAKLTGMYNDQYMTWVNKQGRQIGRANFENGLYHLDIRKESNPFESGEVVAATVNFDDPVWKWHRRLGHLGFQNMLKLLDSSTGMNVTAEQIRAKLKAVCPVCAVTRALVKIPRDPAKRHAREPGQMVHVDSWGPYPIEGFDGTRYFLFITDDCTRYTWCARFDHKHQLFEMFKTLVKFIQKTYNIIIRCCRLDNEFERGPIGRWCDAHAIAREPIEPYAHYQNGVAERTNRTIRERASPMVQEASISEQISKIVSEKSTELLRVSRIPENLWPEAVQHAVWLKNRAPARALRKKETKTPYEALKGEKPTLSRERIWGSRAYVTYPPEFRDRADMTKLHSPRGWLGYFVGCESEAMYHIYSPEKHKVYRVGAARVDDGEGLTDSHDLPCYEDRLRTLDVSSQDSRPVDGQWPSEDEDSESDGDGLSNEEPETTSRYFNHSRHAGMAKRKITDNNNILAPKRSRQATHEQGNCDEQDELSESSTTDSDSWYYSDDGKISQHYWNFTAKHGRHKARYLPDDGRCDHCFRYSRTCDMASEGIPCSVCKERRSLCRKQTKETKRLILPKNRGRSKEIAGTKQDPPCRKCFQQRSYCYLNGRPGSKCELCTRTNRPCDWNLEGAKQSRPTRNRTQGNAESIGSKPTPRDKKCYRCASKVLACDGKYPCNKCNTDLLRRSCRPQGVEKLPSCVKCTSTGGKACDRGRPCKACIAKKFNCTYVEQGGLVLRTYRASDTRMPAGFVSIGALTDGEGSDDECSRCQLRKKGCDGEKPCLPCVRAYGNQVISHCHYRRSDGTYESWATRPYEINDEGIQKLRGDYETYDGHRRHTKSRQLLAPEENAKNKHELDGESDDGMDGNELKAIHEASKAKLKNFKFGLSAYRGQPIAAARLKIGSSTDAKYYRAKKEELKSHEEKGTWRVVPLPEGVKPVTSRWVNTDKYGPDGQLIKHKSRLVARGFQQEEGIDYEETFASVVKPASTRILLALAAILSWRIHQGDVKTAFLNSNLDKPVYMRPPKDIRLPHGYCLMVVRALYGLRQSPRAWYQKLRNTLINWGWRVSAYDPCVFINDNTGLILEVHVDDINVMGKDLQKILDFKAQISQTFQMTDEGECSWYLGMHVEQRPGEVRIHQKKYIDEIVAKYGFQDAASVKTPLEKDVKLHARQNYTAHPKFRKEYQSKVGSLNFASNQTRPEIAFATGYVARYASNPDQTHMKAVNRIFMFLKDDPGKGILYSGKHGLQLRGFVDSDFAGCEDSRKSTTGWVFTLAGGPVSWSSQRQKTVATSTMDAEYIAGAEAAKEAVWIRNFINDLRIPGVHIGTVPLYIDNNSALKLTRNPEFHSRSKHIDVKHHFIREKVDDGVIDTLRVETADNLADIFTKGLPKPTHTSFVDRLNCLSGGDVKRQVDVGAENSEAVIKAVRTSGATLDPLVVSRPSGPSHRGRVGSQVT